MTRLPEVAAKDLVRFLTRQGFERARQSGSHLTLWHPERHLAVTVPLHQGRTLGRGLVARILKDAGLTIGDYLAGR